MLHGPTPKFPTQGAVGPVVRSTWAAPPLLFGCLLERRSVLCDRVPLSDQVLAHDFANLSDEEGPLAGVVTMGHFLRPGNSPHPQGWLAVAATSRYPRGVLAVDRRRLVLPPVSSIWP